MSTKFAFALLALGAMSWPSTASPQPADPIPTFHMDVVGHLPMAPVYSVADVWAAGDIAFVARETFGMITVDLSDPSAPQLADVYNPGPGALRVNDVKVAGDLAFLSNESWNGQGLIILDVSDPYAIEFVSAIVEPDLYQVHNLHVEDDVVYITGNTPSGWQTHIYDVSDPQQPALLTILSTKGTHDVYVQDGILYESGGWKGIQLWDVSDPANPVHLAAADTNAGDRPHYHAHNIWPSPDGRTLFTTNEITSEVVGEILPGGLKIWQWDGAGEIVQIGSWEAEQAAGDPWNTIHNVQVIGDVVFVSYYQSGVRVLDVRDPARPVEVAFADTFVGESTELFQGCWGVFADPSGRVLASDRLSGLYVLQWDGARRATIAGRITDATGMPIAGATVRSIAADRAVDTGAAGIFSLASAHGAHTLQISAPGYVTKTIQTRAPTLLTITLDAPSQATEHVPSTLALEPAYPNPTRAGTRWQLHAERTATTGNITARVRDVTGRTIRRLPRVDATPGNGRAIDWDGRTEAGRAAPAGIYWLEVESPGEAPIRSRIVLVR